MPGASLFETSMLCLFVALSVWTKKNESHILIFLEDIADQRILKSLRKTAYQGQDSSKLIYLFISLMTIQVQQKQQQSIPEILRMKECSNLIGQE